MPAPWKGAKSLNITLVRNYVSGMSQRLENALPSQVSDLKTVQTFILKPGREYVNMLLPDLPTRDFFLIKAVMCHFTVFFFFLVFTEGLLLIPLIKLVI